MKTQRFSTAALAIVTSLALGGCGDDSVSSNATDPVDSGFQTAGSPSGDPSSESQGPGSSPIDPGTDDGEPPPPGELDELCDAGDEAFVKRLIPFTQGRRPASMREVRLLVSMIEQLDQANINGREAVTLGLLRGEGYLERWFTYLYGELRINVAGDRRNEECYDVRTAAGDSADLAAFIRDNPAQSDFGQDFYMADVVNSALLLDDISPAYRADLLARFSAPMIAGNVTETELEDMRIQHFGSIFESSFLGRNTECMQCHRMEESTTYSADDNNRHFPIPGEMELAVWGLDADAPVLTSEGSYGAFRYFNFAVGQSVILNADPPALPGGYASPFGLAPACGGVRFAAGPSVFGHDPYLITDLAPGATAVDVEAGFSTGLAAVRSYEGLEVGADNSVTGPAGAAYLWSMHVGNRMWLEAMGTSLQVANGFPRNAAQRDLLKQFADAFAGSGFSLRTLVSEIANHAYFNQAAPAECTAASPYHLPAIFDPFTREAADPGQRGNGIGDSVHRHGPFILIDSIARAMWWDRPDHFGPGTGQIPGSVVGGAAGNGCGGAMPQSPCTDEPEDATVLRDLGAFLSDSDPGFEGTDLLTMLRLENEFGQGEDPGMNGACTGPLGSACAGADWITQLVDTAEAQAGSDMWDIASAVKDRLITEPAISGPAEVTAIEVIMGVSLTDTVGSVGGAGAEQAARRFAGALINTPQFVLVGVAPADQDPADDPSLVVAGTETMALCEYLAPFILSNPGDGVDVSYTCTADGVSIN